MAYSERFPLLGFPNEDNQPAQGLLVYQCYVGDARIVVWQHRHRVPNVQYALNIYRGVTVEDYLTHQKDRYHPNQGAIIADDPFEVQLAIFYLLKKYLPPEVTECLTP